MLSFRTCGSNPAWCGRSEQQICRFVSGPGALSAVSTRSVVLAYGSLDLSASGQTRVLRMQRRQNRSLTCTAAKAIPWRRESMCLQTTIGSCSQPRGGSRLLVSCVFSFLFFLYWLLSIARCPAFIPVLRLQASEIGRAHV